MWRRDAICSAWKRRCAATRTARNPPRGRRSSPSGDMVSLAFPSMRSRALISLCALCAAGAAVIAQSPLTPPAVYPHDMSAYGCTHFDDKACDAAPAPPPMHDPLVGQWIRFTLIRAGFSVQPPDAPLYLQFGPDGYWSMMEFPA